MGVHEKEKKKMGGSYFFRLEFAIWLTKIENTFIDFKISLFFRAFPFFI